VDVRVDVEGLVVLPPRTGGVLDRPLAEAMEGEEAVPDRALHLAQVELSLEHEHPDDHHQIRRLLHPEPRGVDA
jgi:hypothetical protein